MTHRILTLALLTLLFAGCGPTRIITYSPAPAATTYSTTVLPSRTHTTTTITQVYSTSEDLSLHLDLQALAALFAQSRSVEEFEALLNNSSYPVSNLDLNGDGYIDYLRVLETIDGYNHVFLVQAVLGANVFQDVATIVAQAPGLYNYYLEVIGAPYIYGPSYVIRPRFYAKPPIFEYLRRAGYVIWRSQWHWDHFPPHYRHPKPIWLNHYQAYVTTYMHGHPYCHEVYYPSAPHYAEYDRMTREMQRNDFGAKHPDRTFTTRNANTPARNGQGNVKNAYDIRQNNESTKKTETSEKRQSPASSNSRTISSSSSRSPSMSSGSSSGSSSSKAAASSASRNSGSGAVRSNSSQPRATSTASEAGSTVTRSKVHSSGSATTTTSSEAGRRSSSSTATRSSSSSKSSGTATRSSSSSTNSGGTATRSRSSSSTRSSSDTSSEKNTSTTRGTRR